MRFIINPLWVACKLFVCGAHLHPNSLNNLTWIYAVNPGLCFGLIWEGFNWVDYLTEHVDLDKQVVLFSHSWAICAGSAIVPWWCPDLSTSRYCPSGSLQYWTQQFPCACEPRMFNMHLTLSNCWMGILTVARNLFICKPGQWLTGTFSRCSFCPADEGYLSPVSLYSHYDPLMWMWCNRNWYGHVFY